ncbi:unnamed protein product, partial [Brachionus calyciflorus]
YPNLITLDLSYNNLSFIEPEFFSDLLKLKSLVLAYCSIKTIELSWLVNLRFLYIYKNQISYFSQNLSLLTHLNINSNPLVNLSYPLISSENSSLEYLDISYCKFKYFDFGLLRNPSNLKTLKMIGNTVPLNNDSFYGSQIQLSYKSNNGRISWRCNNTQFPNCQATVYTNGFTKPIIEGKPHEHNNTVKTKIKEIKANMIEMAAAHQDTQPRKIIMECQKDVSEEIAANLPAYSTSRQICRHNRINPYEKYVIPVNLSFDLHHDFTVILKNNEEEMFLLYDNFDSESDNKGRILIFTTLKNLQILSLYRHWLCDGTFDAAPSIFIQLFTIHIIKNMKNLPLVYALLADKLQVSYTKVFEILKTKISELPLSVTCDYEVAIINSIESVFPDAEIYGCFFHFKKSIWRHIQADGLVVDYCDLSNENNLIRLYCKLIACLAFVPPEDVIEAFVVIKKQAPIKLNKIYKYFEDNYIGGKGRGKSQIRREPRFSIDLWNCFSRTKDGLPRTTNNLEGWHNALQSSIRTHPHLLSLIDTIKQEQSNTENLYVQLNCGRSNK